MTSGPRLPLTVGEVTAGWLAEALGVAVERAEPTGIVWGTATKVLLDVPGRPGRISRPLRGSVERVPPPPLHGAMYALTPEAMQPADVRAALADRFAQDALDLDTLAILSEPRT